MGGVKAGEPRHQPLAGKTGQEADRQGPRGIAAAQLLDGAADARESLAQGRQQAAPGRSQLEPAGEAAEQGDAEVGLQGLHLVTDRRLGDVQLLGGLGEAQVPRPGLEGAQGIERGKPRHGLAMNYFFSFIG